MGCVPQDLQRFDVDVAGSERGTWLGARLFAACVQSAQRGTFAGLHPRRFPLSSGRFVDYYEPTAKQFESDMIDLRRRLLGALSLILVVTLIGIFGFSVIDPNAGFVRAFYMTVITLTTVGFGEEIAVDTDGAQIFTAVLILFGMGATLYFVSTSTAFLLEGQLGNVFRRKKMVRDLAALRGHMIVCGSGSTALYAAAELSTVERPVVLIVPVTSEPNERHPKLSRVPIVVGDPTDDATLEAAGITRAHGLIACAHSDNENVVITLTARQLNPNIRIVARLQDVSQEAKVRKVGANAVVSPQHIGGMRLASELIRPTVVTFLDRMLRDRDKNLRIDEVLIPEGAPAAGKAINALGLENFPGILLLAVRSSDGGWQYNPQRTQIVEPGQVLIFLGSPKDSKALRDRLGGEFVAGLNTAV
jgi:voltage-gated potassium channel